MFSSVELLQNSFVDFSCCLLPIGHNPPEVVEKTKKLALEVIHKQIALHADVTQRDRDGLTLLHVAASNDLLQEFDVLKDLGADVCTKDNDGATPLHSAVLYGQIKAREKLLALGADVNAKDNEGMTPLHYAGINGQVKEIDALSAQGSDVDIKDTKGRTPLHLAAFYNQADAIESLIAYGANMHERWGLLGLTALHLAAGNGQVEALEKLIFLGADVHSRDNHGLTALHIAAGNGQVEALEKLIILGADVHSRDEDEATPLQHAAIKGQVKAIEKLIFLGADVHSRDANNRTPLLNAAYGLQEEAIEVLKDLGADLNVREKEGRGPFCLALPDFRGKAVDKLFELGSQFSFDDFGQSSLDVSTLFKYLSNVLVKFKEEDGGQGFVSYHYLFSVMSGYQKYFGRTYFNEILEAGINNFLFSRANQWFFLFSTCKHQIPILLMDDYLLLFNRGGYRKASSIVAWKINRSCIAKTEESFVLANINDMSCEFIYDEFPKMLEGEKDIICKLIEETANHKDQNFGNCFYVGPICSIIGWMALKNVLASKTQDENDLRVILKDSFAEGKILSDYSKQYILWLTVKKMMNSSELSQDEKQKFFSLYILGSLKLNTKFLYKSNDQKNGEKNRKFYLEMFEANLKLNVLINNWKEPLEFNFNERFEVLP